MLHDTLDRTSRSLMSKILPYQKKRITALDIPLFNTAHAPSVTKKHLRRNGGVCST